MPDDALVLLACGDVGPIHPPMEPYSALVGPVLATGDIRFAQCERVYSKRGALQLHASGRHSRLDPAMASIFSDCGFDVASLASNHAMDWGEDALLDTIEVLNGRGIQTIGAGRNIAEATKPAIFERNGIRIAVVAFCSILDKGFEARENKAGVAPMRAHTYYRAFDRQPGVPPQVVTVPYERDLKTLTAAVANARQQAQVVVLSLHWGIHHIPVEIADYQFTVADAAFKAGADVIVGHHAHLPKGIGMRKGRVCFYSLSNFIMSTPALSAERARVFTRRYGIELDPDYPHFTFDTNGKRSLIAKLRITSMGITEVSFLPVIIDKQLRPEVIRGGDDRFDEMLDYMRTISEGLGADLEAVGDEIVIRPSQSAGRR